jgi:predicted transcriptional regulator
MDFTEPKKYSGGTVSISVGLPAEIKLKLDALAEASRISRNKLIVSAIVELLKKYGKE